LLELCQEFHILNPAELLKQVDSRLLSLWIAKYKADPWGKKRSDIQAGIVASAVYGSQGVHTRIEDFLPEFLAKSEEEVEAGLKALLGGTK